VYSYDDVSLISSYNEKLLSHKLVFFYETGYRKNKFEVFIIFRECLLQVRLESFIFWSAVCKDIGKFTVLSKDLNTVRLSKCVVLYLWPVQRGPVLYESGNKYDSITRTPLSYSDLFLPTHCRCRGLLLHLITLSGTHILSRTPLDEWSVRHRDLYLPTHNSHKRQSSMPPVGSESGIPASRRLQTQAFDPTATGIG